MKFQSKRDWWLMLICVIAIAAIFFPLILDGDLTGLWAGIPVTALILWIYFTTYYVIEDSSLRVRSAFINKLIPIYDIRSIKKTFNPLSSPALSMDRLEIRYGTNHMVLISPENRDVFLDELKRRNPAIQMDV